VALVQSPTSRPASILALPLSMMVLRLFDKAKHLEVAARSGSGPMRQRARNEMRAPGTRRRVCGLDASMDKRVPRLAVWALSRGVEDSASASPPGSMRGLSRWLFRQGSEPGRRRLRPKHAAVLDA
jgi:hypothetical protein